MDIRQIIEKKLVYQREIFSPRHHNRKDGCGQQPPFFLAFHNEKSQHKKETNDCSNVHGARSKGLRSPICGQSLHERACLGSAVAASDSLVGLAVLVQ